MKSNMVKPELNNLPTQSSENFRLFGNVCFSVFFYVFFYSLIFSVLKWPRSHSIIYCFLSGEVCTKSISRALTEWANQSLFLSTASDSFNNDGTLNFLSYLTTAGTSGTKCPSITRWWYPSDMEIRGPCPCFPSSAFTVILASLEKVF